MRFRYRRGTKEENDQYVGLPGEVTLDVDSLNLRIHDGSTPGGRVMKSTDFDQTDVENLIGAELYLHSQSGDHDGRYYKKNVLDGLIEGLINLKENRIHAQDVLRYVDNDGEIEYGWVDNVSNFEIRGQGNSDPDWQPFRSGIRAYRFEAGKMNEVWSSFHINHDYALGTPVYPHVHWSPEDDGLGTVRWGFEYTVAKGHAQAEGSVFEPTTIVHGETEITEPSAYKHFVTETSDELSIPPDKLEPDSIVLIRFFRDANNDTYNGGVFGLKSDLHYQAARFATKNKAPNFFGDE